MALDTRGAWSLENDGDEKRERIRKDTLRGAFETERAGYLQKAEAATDEATRERYTKRAAEVLAAAKAEGVPLSR